MAIKFTEKHKDFLALALRKKTRLLVLEGTVRSSKTVIAIQAFFYRVWNSDAQLHMIAGRDFDTINNNLLQNDMGLITQFPNHCRLKKDKIGGYYVELTSPKGIKKILIVGFTNRSKWTKILGLSIDTILVDEVNIADEMFIKECFARQVSFDAPLTLWTLNGDEPTHYIYTDFINRCGILNRKSTPTTIIVDMDKVKKEKGWYYLHWTMKDNPVMTDEKIEVASSIYPVGSFYYIIKILGERGTPGELLYIDYLDADKHIKPLHVRDYNRFGIGFDIGATRAYNSISLVGFKPGFRKVGLIDKHTFKQCGYEEKTRHLIAFLKRYKHLNIKYVSVDSAEQNYITDLQTLFKKIFPTIEVISSYKATIKERVDLMIILLSHGQFEFNDAPEGKDAYDAFMIAKKGKKPKEVREDLNERHNDIIDSVEYAITRHMNALLKASKEYELFKDSEVA